MPPRFGTLRNPKNPTRGTHEAKIAEIMGMPYMPWQQYVADVTGEVDPKTGIPVYREIVITMPRQQGKTTTVLIKKVHRAIGFGGAQNIRFTAQSKDDARVKWLEHVAILEESPFASAFTKRVTNGSEQLTWLNGSKEYLKSGTARSGHGATLDLGIISEAFAQIDNRIATSMRPTMITRPAAQLLVESTAGTAQSIYLNDLVKLHRERLEQEPDAPSRVAYFEWSALESDDPADPATWLRCMPALGHTIQLAEIQHEYDNKTSLAEFTRSFLNLTDWGATHIEGAIDWDAWLASRDQSSEIIGDPFIGLDVAPDRTWSSIGLEGPNRKGVSHVQLAKRERGTAWVVDYLRDRLREMGLNQVAIVARSAAATMQEALERAGIEVLLLDSADTAAACGRLFDEIENEQVAHLADGQGPLDAAVAGVQWSTGERRVFSRAKSGPDLSPLYAVAVAKWARVLAESRVTDILQTIA